VAAGSWREGRLEKKGKWTFLGDIKKGKGKSKGKKGDSESNDDGTLTILNKIILFRSNIYLFIQILTENQIFNFNPI
jgi:hypothetical protein